MSNPLAQRIAGSSSSKLAPPLEQLLDDGRSLLAKPMVQALRGRQRLLPDRWQFARTELHAGIERDVSEVAGRSQIGEANLAIRRLPARTPRVQPVPRAAGSRREQHRRSDCKDVVLQAAELPRSVDDAHRRRRRRLEAADPVEIRDFFCLDELIVVGIGRRTLHSNQYLPGSGAADAETEPSGADHAKVSWREGRTLAAHETVEGRHAV